MRLLTLARDLRRRKARDKHGLFVAEGVRAVDELLRSPLVVRGVLVAPQLADAPRGSAVIASAREQAVAVEEVSPREFATAADTESPQGVLAVAEVPEYSFARIPASWAGVILVLDALQDPGNAGTILRTAAALGAAATVTMPGTVDLWNAKVVRSGMGAHFRHPAFSSTWTELDTFRASSGAALLAADAAGAPVEAERPAQRTVLVVGNEGAGISAEARQRADRVVSVPIHGQVESLNVAVATGILLYALTQ